MRLSMTTLGCSEWNFNKIVGFYKDLGVNGIEIRGVGGTMDLAEMDFFSPENENDTKKYLRANHMTLTCLDTSCFFNTDENTEKALAEGKKTLDVCARFGVPYMRVFCDGIPGAGDEKFDETLNKVISGLGRLLDIVKDSGVKVLIEIHGDFNIIDKIKPVIDAHKDHPAFGILWDIAHTDRAYGDNIEEVFELIRPYIYHVHMKDHFRRPNMGNQLTDFGEGEIPLSKICKMLRDSGYDGYYSFEHEKKWHPELSEPEVAYPKFVQLMKSLEEENEG